MTDFNIATGEEQPLNRTGVDNAQITGEKQGVPVGIDNSGTEPQLVAADADSTVAIPAVGVLFPREILPADLSNVTQHPWDDVEKQIYKEQRTLTGDRATVVRYGIEMVNDDDDTSFTPGEPVYLAAGGGFTNTPPTGGDLVQQVGVALTPMEGGVNPNNPTKDRIMLTVEDAVESKGDFVGSGDGSTGGQTFTITHNLPEAPSRINLLPKSSEAAANHYVSGITATSFDVTYPTAPTSGTDNVTLHWEAQE